MSIQSIVLNNTVGGASKTYHASLVPEGDGYLVNFAYGRIGSTLKTGTKTQSPVELKKAQSIYDKLVNSKIKKNYVPEGGEATAFTEQCKMEHSGIELQLLNEVNEEELEALFKDPNICAQIKQDGERRAVKIESGQCQGINKKGQFVPVPKNIEKDLERVLEAVIDGEIIGNEIYAFDVLSFGNQCHRGLPYQERMAKLSVIASNYEFKNIHVVETAYSEEDKRALFELTKNNGYEGVVFKRIDKAHKGNRPASGGDQLKFKHWKTASVIVMKHNEKRSVVMGIVDSDGVTVSCGNVTIPINEDVPEVGEVIEVRYLYAYKKSGKLFQQTFLKKRKTVESSECLVSQLHYKVH